MKHIEQTYSIKAPLAEVWRAFVDPEVIEQWGGGPAKMSAKEGTEFSLWGGDIHGTNTKVESPRLLEQDWYSGADWPEPSKLRFEFSKIGDVTTIKLTQSNVPDAEADDIAQGWKDYYLGAIKELLETK
jgi:activator of HSP90 ATPase